MTVVAPQPVYTADQLRRIAAQKAAAHGVPVDVFTSQIGAESNFDPNAHSGAGADGIAQFIPSTAKSYGLTNTRDPIASLDAAARYDADLLKKYGTPARMLSAYNSGRPDAYLDPGFAGGETHNYVAKILRGGGTSGAGVGSAAAPTPAPGVQVPNIGFAGDDPRQAFARDLMAQIGRKKPDVGSSLRSLYGGSPDAAGGAVALSGLSGPGQPVSGAPGAPGGAAAGAVESARSQLGTPYQFGGEAKLGSMTDCSGLLQAAYAANGVRIPRTTYQQWATGTPVDAKNLRAGDAVFFNMGPSGPEHVGIYVGNGQMIDDPHTGATVRMEDFAKFGGYVGARRFA